MNIQISAKWTKISALIVVMAGISTLHFNCAPTLFESAKEGSVEGLSVAPPGPGSYEKPKSPYTLLTSHQIFSGMLNVTGQVNAVSTTMRAEYDARTAALADNDNLTNIGAPMQMSLTSLAGEVCNGLIVKESAAGATRRFFNNVDFSANLAGNSKAAFDQSVGMMSKSFWGRAPTSVESGTLDDFYADWITSYAGDGATSTRRLYLGVCSAMLSSLDAIIN